MKKLLSTALIATMCLGVSPAMASIADEKVVYEASVNTATGETTVITDKTAPTLSFTAPLQGGAIRVVVDNKELTERGVSVDNRTLVPLRALGESLKATVNWDNATGGIRIEKMLYQMGSDSKITESNRIILMTVGNKTIQRNGDAKELDVAPQIVDGKTMVPVRAVTDFLEAKVTYDAVSKTVFVESALSATPQGAQWAKEGSEAALGNAIDNRVAQINKELAVEQEKAEKEYMAINKPKGDLKAWGYDVDIYGTVYSENPSNPNITVQIIAFEMYSPMDRLGHSKTDEEINQEKFRLAVVDKASRKTVHELTFIYGELENTGRYKELTLPKEYLDEDKFDYQFFVVVD